MDKHYDSNGFTLLSCQSDQFNDKFWGSGSCVYRWEFGYFHIHLPQCVCHIWAVVCYRELHNYDTVQILWVSKKFLNTTLIPRSLLNTWRKQTTAFLGPDVWIRVKLAQYNYGLVTDICKQYLNLKCSTVCTSATHNTQVNAFNSSVREKKEKN